uniref:Uncharacterized protein n=1 Tax=Globodera rostochiensis TaxID=31243 RepID=A0A914H3V0_GLORO
MNSAARAPAHALHEARVACTLADALPPRARHNIDVRRRAQQQRGWGGKVGDGEQRSGDGGSGDGKCRRRPREG